MFQDFNFLSSLLEKCFWTAMVSLAVNILCGILCDGFSLLSHFFRAQNENLDEIFSEVIACKRIRAALFVYNHSIHFTGYRKSNVAYLWSTLFQNILSLFFLLTFNNNRVNAKTLILHENIGNWKFLLQTYV